MKLDNIKSIIDLMEENGLTEFEMEEDGVRISIKKGITPPVAQPGAAAVPPVAEGSGAATSEAETASADTDDACEEIKAPFVGTFYRSSSPDAEQYVSVGQQVEPDTVLCIIEAMKVMNEIKAEVGGVVREILVENAHPVQYGQPLFKIEKS
ncbi:acetyl-CoA carboxylase biotin carboxyl carrier protein [Verrucomicrobiota bacterium]